MAWGAKVEIISDSEYREFVVILLKTEGNGREKMTIRPGRIDGMREYNGSAKVLISDELFQTWHEVEHLDDVIFRYWERENLE